MLPLVKQATGGAGVAGRLAALALSLRMEEDCDPRKAATPVVELTPGWIEPE